MSVAGSSARSVVRSSVSVVAARRARPPSSWVSSSRVFTRLPLCPIATARRGPSRNVGWAFSQIVEPVVEYRQWAMARSPRKRRQPPVVEDLGDHAEVLVQEDLGAVADREAGRFLAAMLEPEEARRGDRGGLRTRAGRQRDAEHAAHSADSRPER